MQMVTTLVTVLLASSDITVKLVSGISLKNNLDDVSLARIISVIEIM